MSANLLADLDSFYAQEEPQKPQVSSQAQHSSFNTISTGQGFAASGFNQEPFENSQQWSTSHSAAQDASNDDDDFGDFETAQTDSPQIPESSNGQQAYNRADPFDWLGDSGNIHDTPVASRVQPSREAVRTVEHTRPTATLPYREDKQPRAPVHQRQIARKPRDENVLFDASDEEDEDDDFGDFEGFRQEESQQSSKAYDVKLLPIERRPDDFKPPPKRGIEPSLLDFGDDESTNFTSPVLPANRSQNSLDFAWNAPEPVVQPKPSKAPNYQAHSNALQSPSLTPEQQQEEAWIDFEPAAPPSTNISGQGSQSVQASTGLDLPSILPADATLPTSQQPPSNIPPPAVLLSLVTSILATGKSRLFDPLAALSSASENAARSAILTHPSTEAFLQAYLAVIVVAGRIVAGRKLRWKRDTLLSQSMRIGPSLGGRSGGMKLAGVDKGESAKEEREVADVVRAYRAQVGRLRTAVAGAGLVGESGSAKVHVPELAEAIPVRTATGAEGAVTATKACALCGIKRNERVAKVDGDVSDAFGEWWIEYWGHRTCRNFWEGKKNELAQR